MSRRGGGIDSGGVQPQIGLLFGTGQPGAETVTQLLAPLTEAGAHDAEEASRGHIGDLWPGAQIQAHNTAIDFWGGQKSACGTLPTMRARA